MLQNQWRRNMQNQIGAEMRDHGVFQTAAPEQPAKCCPGQSVQADDAGNVCDIQRRVLGERWQMTDSE